MPLFFPETSVVRYEWFFGWFLTSLLRAANGPQRIVESKHMEAFFQVARLLHAHLASLGIHVILLHYFYFFKKISFNKVIMYSVKKIV